MNNAELAKSLLLDEKTLQMRRFHNSRNIKFFIKYTGFKSRIVSRRYLKNLAKYITHSFGRFKKKSTKIRFTLLDFPEKNKNWIIMEIICPDNSCSETAINRFKQYSEIALK